MARFVKVKSGARTYYIDFQKVVSVVLSFDPDVEAFPDIKVPGKGHTVHVSVQGWEKPLELSLDEGTPLLEKIKADTN